MAYGITTEFSVKLSNNYLIFFEDDKGFIPLFALNDFDNAQAILQGCNISKPLWSDESDDLFSQLMALA